MRTQSIEVGRSAATRKEELIRKAVVCPDRASTVQPNILLVDKETDTCLKRKFDLLCELRALNTRLAGISDRLDRIEPAAAAAVAR